MSVRRLPHPTVLWRHLTPIVGRWWQTLAVLGLIASLLIAWDWHQRLPGDATYRFVGRESCITCHAAQAALWEGSDHDHAMEIASPSSVLGDFNDATLVHHGVTSRMFRRNGGYYVATEGRGGNSQEHRVKYTFGFRPLQQYLVEFDRQPNQPANEEARLQVLRLSWDTEQRRWFHLDPPDVADKLAADDPLHWTGRAQNWNHMCANCHSTNVHKNFDVASVSYHTTYSELDVSCEACHGPGSIHVQLSRRRSWLWDRGRGSGLRTSTAPAAEAQIQTCAKCHSRRAVVAHDDGLSNDYYDCYENEPLRPETYYPDGQVRDEVYEFGSFVQSKMYHKGIRCTDCHDPHSTRLKAKGNQVCTSCHQHPATKYDTPAHHHHRPDTTGSRCVECHMPASPFMQVDWRRDHSLRVPRPDLSNRWQTPNACASCHYRNPTLPASSASPQDRYVEAMQRARAGDQDAATELAHLNQWAAEACRQWYGETRRPDVAAAFGAAWRGNAPSDNPLANLVQSRESPAILRASSLAQLAVQSPARAIELAPGLLNNPHPQLRATAIRSLAPLDWAARWQLLHRKLHDPVRIVRQLAAETLVDVPPTHMNTVDLPAFQQALEEHRAGLREHSDQAGAHLSLALLEERLGHPDVAMDECQRAIHVQPDVTGPRTKLAELLDRQGRAEDANRWRREELQLLARDAKLAPELPHLQYEYGLALYREGRAADASEHLARACQLAPRDADYRLAYLLLLEKLERYPQAWQQLEALQQLQPDSPTLEPIRERLSRRVRSEKVP